jgi:hypothetical protein
MVEEIKEIFDARHSGANSRAKYIRVDCETPEGELIRYMVPFSVPATPDGPKVVLNYEDATIERDDSGEQPIDKSEIPEEVKDKVTELRGKIGKW